MENFFDIKSLEELHARSPISKYFYGKTIFLTGGSGFLGQLYLEKLLRIGVKSVYVLLRPKKNLTPADRILIICSGPVFDKLRKSGAKIEDRIRVVIGDLSKNGLGICEEDLQALISNVEIVIHSGADVRFNIPLLQQIYSNVRGTKELLQLSEKMTKLARFVYVSTAYSHCVRDSIDECFYPAPMDPEFWIRLADKWTDEKNLDVLDIITTKLIHPWPNTYTFSKSLSEEIVRRHSQRVPAIVVRPSIIISTHEDPIPGWTNNLTGMNGVMLGIGIGFMRNLKMNDKTPADTICADLVTNATLASIWSQDVTKSTESKIIHVTHKGTPISAGDLVRNGLNIRENDALYSMKCIWYPVFRFSTYELEDMILNIFLQAIPAFIMDLFNKNKELRLLPMTRKVESLKNVVSYFLEKELHFGNSNMIEVLDRMNDFDKKIFPSDSRNINILEFLHSYLMGLRIYMANDPIETWEGAKRKKRIQKIAHFSLKYSFFTVLFLFAYFIFFK